MWIILEVPQVAPEKGPIFHVLSLRLQEVPEGDGM